MTLNHQDNKPLYALQFVQNQTKENKNQKLIHKHITNAAHSHPETKALLYLD